MEHSLSAVLRLGDYRGRRENVFPSDNALQWFVRTNRASLIDAGALVMLTGQWHVVEDRFDAFVLDAGRRAARSRAA